MEQAGRFIDSPDFPECRGRDAVCARSTCPAFEYGRSAKPMIEDGSMGTDKPGEIHGGSHLDILFTLESPLYV